MAQPRSDDGDGLAGIEEHRGLQVAKVVQPCLHAGLLAQPTPCLRDAVGRKGFAAAGLALEHEVGRLRWSAGAEPELDRSRPLRAQERRGVGVETDASLRMRL